VTLESVRPLDAAGAERAAGRVTPLAPSLAVFAPVLGLAVVQGGYFPTAWGWASIPLFWAAAVALILRSEARLSRAEVVFLAALAAFTAWLAISAAWSVAPAESVLELERGLVYLAAGLAVASVSRARDGTHVLGALVAAVSLVAAFSLATRLLPDRVGVYDGSGVYRLAQPIGYWNGLALFTAIGALLCLGFAARARTIVARAVCAALLVLLLPTLYFTFGRAAWIALGIGLAAAVAVDPGRLQLLATLLAVAPAPAAAVLVASRMRGLTHAGSPLDLAAHDGHRLALVLAALAVGNAVAAAAIALAGRRIGIGSTVRRAFAAAVIVFVVAGAAVGLAHAGGPVQVVKSAYRSFKAPPPHVDGDLNRRLLNFSGNGRADLWRLAWDDARRQPLGGTGPGTYERYFLAHQPSDVGRVRDAHSLYLETLAEVGPLGLVLLGVALLTPLGALRSARRHPLVPAAAGAYVAYLVHTGVDWDWELPAVTLAGLLCGVAILLVHRRVAGAQPFSVGLRWCVAGGAVAAATFATIALIGNTALSRSESAREHRAAGTALADARRARFLLPWSPAPWQALGRAQLAAGFVGDARRSFRKAISKDSGDWELWYDLARATSGTERARALRQVAVLFPRSGLVR
jgi:O-Antigen ligase